MNTAPTPQASTVHSSPSDLVDAMHSAFGRHHARAVHAKGIILEGSFTPDPDAAGITMASHLQTTGSTVTVRFSDFTGVPNIPDNIGAANPRGLAIKFTMADGVYTDIVSHSFNGFPVSNSDEFRELLLAIGASGPDAPKPTTLDKFLATHPIAVTFLTTQNTPASYSSIAYFGVNAFKFTNANGASVYIRYQFIPIEGKKFLTQEQLAAQSPNYLIDEIRTHVTERPIYFEMLAQVAEEGDPIEDPSIAWPDSRRLVRLGTIKISKLSANTEAEDKQTYFTPNHVPEGIEPADPMIDFRSRAYPISGGDRQ